MIFEKKINARNSAAVIKEVNQMLEAGFPKKETYVVVGKKYNLSYKSVQRIMIGHDKPRYWTSIGHDKPRYWTSIGHDKPRYWTSIGQAYNIC